MKIKLNFNVVRSLFVIAIAARLVFAFLTSHPDVNNHLDWGTRFFEYGAAEFYDPETNVWSFTWPNQPPGTTYIFAGTKIVSDFIFSIFWWINVNVPPFPSNVMYYLEQNLYMAVSKLPAILADLGISYLLYLTVKRLKDKKTAIVAALVFLLNPVIWYNSSLWGQYDSVISFLVLLSFYLLVFKNNLWLATAAFALSIYVKISLAIFIPVFLIVAIKKKFRPKTYLISTAATLLMITLITLPFSDKFPLFWLYELYVDKVLQNQLQVITANAFNIWATIAGIHERPQTLMLGPLSYQVWGILLFAASIIYPLFSLFKKSDAARVFWVLSIISLSSFMFLTNMHERYLYPFFVFFAVIAATTNWKHYFSFSLINIANLYNFWWIPKIGFVIWFLSFGDRLMPRVLGFVSLLLYISLYRNFLRQLAKSKV